jgi:hypothetical protein
MNTLLGAITDVAPQGPMTSASSAVVADIDFGGGGETMPINFGPTPVIPGGPSFGGGSLETPREDIFVKPEVATAEKTEDKPKVGGNYVDLGPPEKKMNMLFIGGGLLLAYFLLFRKK